MKYKKGYKYQLAETFTLQTKILPASPIVTEYIDLDTTGLLTIKKGYAWDGCSGPTWDTKSTQRAGCVHDSLYGLTRADELSQSERKQVDEEFRRILRADGVNRFRAWYYYRAVRKFGLSAASAENRRKVLTAP